MKKLILSLAAIALLSMNSFGQAPEGFKYQAVIRDGGNTILNNQLVGIRMTIQQGSIGGTTVYQETFSPTTNAYGLVNLDIGSGLVVSGNFSTIDWANGPYFIETAVDVSGGSSYSVMGTSQLMSVPYALHANTAQSVINDQVDDADADPNNELQALSFSNDTLYLSNGGSIYLGNYGIDLVDDADADPNNELQALSFSNDTLYLSNGGSIYLGDYGIDLVDDADNNPGNELNAGIVLNGTNLEITDAGGTIITDLSSLQDGVNDADADPNNELQALSFSNDTLYLSNGGSVYLGKAMIFDTLASVVLPGSAVNTATDDFVFGAAQLDYVGSMDDATRFFFDKDKGAFRAGYAVGVPWNEANIGNYSFATGKNTKASGSGAAAFGEYSWATGANSMASGISSTASGYCSTASGNYSEATGSFSYASGYFNTASGYGSVASGAYSLASGEFSIASGIALKAPSAYEFSVGSNNTNYTPNDAQYWHPLDRLFTIGNGEYPGTSSDALVVLKNGNIGFGTSTPDNKLDLVGSFQYTDGNQANGKVLMSDANGVATWQSTSSLVGPMGPQGDEGPQGPAGVGIAQTLSLSGSTLTLSDGGGSVSINDADANPTNEIQTLSVNSAGGTMTISSGNTVNLRHQQYALAISMGPSKDDISYANSFSGDDNVQLITLPFTVIYDGVTYSKIAVSTNGFIEFTNTASAASPSNVPLPSSNFNGPVIAAYWDDLICNSVQYQSEGTTDNQVFKLLFDAYTKSGNYEIDFSVSIHQVSGAVSVKYHNLHYNARGQGATIGFQTAGAAAAKAYPISANVPVLDDNLDDADAANQGWSITPVR